MEAISSGPSTRGDEPPDEVEREEDASFGHDSPKLVVPPRLYTEPIFWPPRFTTLGIRTVLYRQKTRVTLARDSPICWTRRARRLKKAILCVSARNIRHAAPP